MVQGSPPSAQIPLTYQLGGTTSRTSGRCNGREAMLYSATINREQHDSRISADLTLGSHAKMERDGKPYVLRRAEDQSLPPKLSLDYGQALNPQQLAAVTVGEGPSLFIAGAGSGMICT